jgi:hypothetical protein
MTKRLDPHPFRCARHAAPQCRKPGTRHRGAIGDENAYHFAGSFRGAGSAREPGTHEHGPRRNGSGVGVHGFRARPTGRPGMTILP